jgi:serine protease Do
MRSLIPAALLALACTSSPPPPLPLEPIPLSPAVAMGLTVMLKSGGTMCGAVAVGPQMLATAAHCVPFASAQYAEHDDPEDWRAGAVVKRDANKDAAIVLTLEPLTEWATLAPVKRGANVYSVHHGDGRPWHFESGQVEGEPRINRADWTETTVPVSPGASGGGLWSIEGKLCGIVSWYRGSSSYFVPAREIDALIR